MDKLDIIINKLEGLEKKVKTLELWTEDIHDMVRTIYMGDTDPHVGCPAYPNCDEDPNGCIAEMGDDVEDYGNRD